MIIYNVTIQIIHQRATEWELWMIQEHLPEMLETGYITKASLFQLFEEENEELNTVTYVAQYSLNHLDDYHSYLEHQAPVLRKKGLDRFGNDMIAFRTIMKEVYSNARV